MEKESDKLKEVDENKINKGSRKKVILSGPPPSVATFFGGIFFYIFRAPKKFLFIIGQALTPPPLWPGT